MGLPYPVLLTLIPHQRLISCLGAAFTCANALRRSTPISSTYSRSTLFITLSLKQKRSQRGQPTLLSTRQNGILELFPLNIDIRQLLKGKYETAPPSQISGYATGLKYARFLLCMLYSICQKEQQESTGAKVAHKMMVKLILADQYRSGKQIHYYPSSNPNGFVALRVDIFDVNLQHRQSLIPPFTKRLLQSLFADKISLRNQSVIIQSILSLTFFRCHLNRVQ